jgi:hypothetical protein
MNPRILRITQCLSILAGLGLLAPAACSETDSSDGGATSAVGDGDGDGDGTGDGDGDGDGSGDGDGDGDGTGDGDGDGDGDGGTIFDVSGVPDGGGGSNECGCGEDEFSYIWIANSGEHTVSKINTRTMIEEGRYYTRADQDGSPSRTSVSIDARAVVVANRRGGVTKIWARQEDCVDKNNNNQIDTSTGPLDVLAFDEDECIAWHTFVDETTVQRPVAWTSGVLNEETCEYEDQKVWTATGRGVVANGPGYCGPLGTWVHRLNADTGEVEDEIHIPEAEMPCASWGDYGFGYYGGAVDPDNNMWLSTFGAGRIVRVDHDSLEYIVYNGSSYGVTVDILGRPWVGDSPRRFDEANQVWESANPNMPGAGGSGIAEDHEGRMWAATSGGVGWVDRDALTAGDTVALPAQGLYRGISVDVDGYIWAIPLGGTEAFKIDPETYEYESVSGLNSPYSYSDMTGGQLNNVNCGEPEG